MATSKNIEEMVPFRATHPGFVIAEELNCMDVKRKDLAEKIGIRPSHLSELLNGKRPLNAELALKIEEQTELKAEALMRLQAQYNVDVKRIAQRDAEAASRKSSATSTLSIRIPLETYNRLSLAAERQGSSISAFIRNMLNKAAVML